ncbi:amidohydrolase family protein [Algibacter aquimarinus]|uniref:Amidohydrolase family protein n=1 Tax=Algibacter aquimarinus TaxID=1136748 RepID=A0ABP9HG35_9FLAO
MKVRISFILLFLCSLFFLNSQNTPIAYQGALIYPINGNPIENGTLLVQNGKIIAVGSNVNIPQNAIVNDVSGKVIMPGLIDTHSHLGNGSGGDRSGALHPEVRLLDALNPMAVDLMKARSGGITTLNIMPGSGHLMSGQTVYIKNKLGKVIEDLTICNNVSSEICGGMKMANGTNSIRDKPFPGTRAKSAALVRELFIKAQDYQKKLDAGKKDASKMPTRDLKMEALVQILERKRIVHFHTHRHDDVLTAIRISKEFGFKIVLHHVSEAWKVADEIAEAKVPVSLIFIDSPGGKMEAVDLDPKSAPFLEKAGVDVAFHTDDPITDSRLFLRSAAIGVREGMSKQKALEGLTLAGARMLELDDRIGSLEKGKDADFIILSGDPLSVYTHVEETWIEGQKVYDRKNKTDKAFAVGGYQVYPETTTHVHD